MKQVDLGIGNKHESVQRDYFARVTPDKYKRAEKARKFEYEYFDEPGCCYGGYNYIPGYWDQVINRLIKYYNIKEGDRIGDIGCSKGFFLKNFQEILPVEVAGIDISHYAIENAHPDVKNNLALGNVTSLPYPDNYFDLVVSFNTIHNLHLEDTVEAFKEVERVGKNKYIVVESYRNTEELFNLLNWQLTCTGFYSPEDWQHIMGLAGYTGDFDFIYFR